MTPASTFTRVATTLVRPTLWFCACNLLTIALYAQCSNPTQVPNQTDSSGTYSYSDPNALSASNVVVNGSASMTFVAGTCIQLLPAFHVTAGTATPTFHASIGSTGSTGSGGTSSSGVPAREYIRLNGNLIAIETTGQGENVSTPSTPTGATTGAVGTSYTFATGGSADSLGNPVQYEFNWGDGSNSGWLTAGTVSASHTWSASGAYSVTSQARSASNTSILSGLSSALLVAIGSAPLVSTPNTPSGPTTGLAGTSYNYTTGGSTATDGSAVQYLFNWGDGTNSGWLATGTTTATHVWGSTGSFPVTAQARSATNTSLVSGLSAALVVTMNDPIPVPVSFSARGTYQYTQTFDAVVKDYAGASATQIVQDWFWSSAGNCHLEWIRSVNLIYLDSSAANYNWVGNGTPGQSGTLSNGVCQVNLGASSVSSSGTNTTLTANITFNVAATFTENVSATNAAGSDSWTYFGSWDVPPYAQLYISNTSFHAGDSWTLSLYTNMPNTSFSFCSIHDSQSQVCAPNFGTTDSYGNWTVSGSFDTSVLGSWQEWAQFPAISSNSVFFTINP